MGMGPAARTPGHCKTPAVFSGWGVVTVLAVLTGLLLSIDAIGQSSATYDEVAYLRVAAGWWRTGDQSEITRMGSPLTFWKLQQVPVLWLLDLVGPREWVDNPIGHQRQLLPLVRLGSLWIWLTALALTAAWSRSAHGPRAMALAAWLFALSPNLIAHGSLATMELPLVAATTAMFWFFWRFLSVNRRPWFWASAAAGGVALSCKFTAIIFPPILCVVWWLACWQDGARDVRLVTRRVAAGMVGFVLLMLLTNFLVTGFARIPLSRESGHHPTLEKWLGPRAGREFARLYETPIPQDWVGFATQTHHQASGGASYLLGERRTRGWWYYYFVALAVKVPLSFWLLVIARGALARASALSNASAGAFPPLAKGGLGGVVPALAIAMRRTVSSQAGVSTPPGLSFTRGGEESPSHALGVSTPPDPPFTRGGKEARVELLPVVFLLFLTITALGSSRNYGVRYILPLAPIAIVWVSALAQKSHRLWPGIAACLGLAGYAAAIVGSHPYELTYFNILAGGPQAGRHILSDSNLDWGQGLKNLASLQRAQPDFRDMTLYYFGDTDPAIYGVAGRCHVINAVDDQSRLSGLDRVETAYVAVSASLQWGPWGPPGFFADLNRLRPVRLTDDTTIAIYRTADLRKHLAARQ